MQSPALSSLFQAGAILAGSSRTEGAPDLKNVLISRLSLYCNALGREDISVPDDTLEAVQLKTAQEALSVVDNAQRLLSGYGSVQTSSISEASSQTREEMIGSRDLAQVRTLLSIIFKWAIQPLLAHVIAAIPAVSPGARRRTEVNIIDLTTVPDDYKILSEMVSRLIGIVLPQGLKGPPNSTLITNAFMDRHLSDLLRPCVVLGWLPKSAASESVAPIDELRPLVVHIINMIPVSQSITALSALLADSSSLPYVRKACSYLLSRQLLRRDGVRGMLSALFSEEDALGDDAPLEKLENVARLLKSLPIGMKETDYYANIISQLLAILSSDVDNAPLAHKRAAAFATSRLLLAENNSNHAAIARILLPALHRPFLHAVDVSAPPGDLAVAQMTVLQTIAALETLLTNTDPSPVLISNILTPIVPSLYSLLSKLEKVKISDPALRMTLRGLLGTWGRLIGASEGAATIWLIVNGEGGEWKVDVAGEIVRIEESEETSGLALFTPEDLQRAEESGELDIDANILNLRPDPAQFIAFLKSLDRGDFSSEIFVRLLEAYQETKTAKESDPTKTLLYLQLIMKLQMQPDSGGDSSFNILQQPDQILAFIKHALDAAREQMKPKPKIPTRNQRRQGLALEDLRIVTDEDEDMRDEDGDRDSDDEDEGMDSEEEMTSTALNLLLSVLEANPDLSAQSAPILDEIFTVIEHLAKEGSESIKPLAREARMVLIARLASSSVPSFKAGAKSKEETPEKKYQKALKLLQDPILPVRAHGLLLLRELVSLPKVPSESGTPVPVVDRALIPGILSIFLQSLQDDDSYIFLNAVQGLAAMVDGFGKEVLRGLVEMYAQGLEGLGGTAVTKTDVDTRTRVGEALGQVIKRCGDTLTGYADMLVPPFFALIRSSHLPATLRTSALSLLALCATTSALAILPYATDLASAMIDLVQVETVPVVRQPQAHPQPRTDVTTTDDEQTEHSKTPGATVEDVGEEDEHAGEEESEDRTQKEVKPGEKSKPDSTEFKPTTTSSKIPPLRRAALHFLILLTRAYAAQVDDASAMLSSSPSVSLSPSGPGTRRMVYVLPPDVLKRARTTAGYVAATDEDGIVRVMAGELVESLDGLAEVMLGL